MNIIDTVRAVLRDPLATFTIFERGIAGLCIAIPVFLRLADGGYPGWRPSISDYVSMNRSYIFGMLLCMAAMLFIYNGAVYFRNETSFGLKRAGKWYNVILGLCLLGIILLPNYEYATVHYFFSGIFFGGNAVVIGLFHNEKDRVISIVLAVLTVAALVLHYTVHWPSLLFAEWFSLAVIAAHFIMQSRMAPGSRNG